MQFRKAISMVVLVALMTWSLSALCAPLPAMHGPGSDRLAYRAMVIEHPATQKCCAPEKMIVIVCYRMHGDGSNPCAARCAVGHGEEAISGTAKYHDDGQARACAMAHATNLLMTGSHFSGATWERAGHPLTVFESKADLRV